MKNIFALLVLLLAFAAARAQTLYLKTFGSATAMPIIFLHGGPGYNCAAFEITAAQKLADSGFFVILYDRRGEGRSIDKDAKYTFAETFDDLNGIYLQFHLEKATLLGHSFGGIVGTLFAEKYPDKINSLVLLSAPVNLQETFKTIIKSVKAIYTAKNDTVNLNYMTMLGNMNTASMQYASYCFAHAMNNGFYSPKNMTDEAKAIYTAGSTDPLIGYTTQMTYETPKGFSKNENYTTIDLTPNLKNLVKKKVKVYGLYGKEDGLYSKDQVEGLEKIIGAVNAKYLDNCSHNVFIDQQPLFIDALKTWVK